jgi:hypothetical protein
MKSNAMLSGLGQDANQGRLSMPISFILDGQIVVGKLVSIEEFHKGATAGGADIYELNRHSDSGYIHVEVDYFVSNGQITRVPGRWLWRVRAHAVNGFGVEVPRADDDPPITIIE